MAESVFKAIGLDIEVDDVELSKSDSKLDKSVK